MTRHVVNLQDRPMYGFGQVDAILGLESGTAKRWIDGYVRAGREYPPIIREKSTGDEIVTWGEFVETRLVSEYRDRGALVARMRPAIELLRAYVGPYPLAQAQTWLGVDSRELVQRVQESVGLDPRLALVVVRNGQQMIDWSPQVEEFTQSVEWSKSGEPQMMRLQQDLPSVAVNPLRGYGEPAVRGVPTEIIRELYAAGDSIEMIAELYELDPAEVNDAVRYELQRSSRNAA